MRSWFRFAAGMVVTAVLLYLAFYNVDPREFWASFRSYDPWWALGSVVLFAVSVLCRALMWRVTTRRMGAAPLSVLYGGVVVGYLGNNLLPLRAGELVRTYYLARRRGFPYAGVLSTVVVERVTDVVVLGLLLAGGLVAGLGGLNPARGREALVIMLALLLLLALGLGLLRFSGGRGRRGWAGPHLEHFMAVLANIASGTTALKILAFGVLAWLANWASMLVLVSGVAYRGNPWATALLLLLYVNLGVLIPSSPGAFGVMQVAFFAALYPFGVAKAAALALSFIYQAAIYLFTLAVGLPYLFRAHLRLAALAGDRRP